MSSQATRRTSEPAISDAAGGGRLPACNATAVASMLALGQRCEGTVLACQRRHNTAGPRAEGLLRPARQCTALASRRCRVAGQHQLPTCTTRQPLPPGRALTYRVKGVLKASKTAERQQGEGRCAQQGALPAGVGDVPPWQLRRDRLLHPLYSVAWTLTNRRRQQNLTQVSSSS